MIILKLEEVSRGPKDVDGKTYKKRPDMGLLWFARPVSPTYATYSFIRKNDIC